MTLLEGIPLPKRCKICGKIQNYQYLECIVCKSPLLEYLPR